MQVPVISAAHVKPDTLAVLSAVSPDKTNGYGICAFPTHDGAMVFASDPEALTELPEDLQACLKWNIANGHHWLRLDADGDEVNLPLYTVMYH